jgi:hypothetical protein
MSWDYETYLSQPTWFILILLELFRAEAQEASRRNQ